MIAIEHDSNICQRFGALGLANLASSVPNQVKIVQKGGLSPIVALVGDPHREETAKRYGALALANVAATIGNHAGNISFHRMTEDSTNLMLLLMINYYMC